MPRVAHPLAFLLAVMVTVGCGGSSRSGTAGPAFLSLGTAPPGGTFFVVGGAIGEVLNEAGGGTWNVTAESTSGSQENIRRLTAGELDLAMSNSSITYFAVRGTEGWDRAYPVRAVMTLAPNVVMFVTPSSSGIRRVSDLRGQRVYVGPAGAGFEYFIKPIVQAHGLTYDDFTPINGTQASAVDMLADGSVAAAMLGGAVPTASITQVAATRDVVMIPYDDPVKLALIEEYPFFSPATIPANTYRGQTEDFHGLDVGAMHLITSASAGDDLIYRVTRAIYENRERVASRHAAGLAINAANVVRNTGTDFHPGAIRYYKEIGIWPN